MVDILDFKSQSILENITMLPIDRNGNGIIDYNEEIYDDVRIIFYQSIRELLINVVKHAQATTATVMVSKDDTWMRVRIEDDGKGFLVSPDGFKVSAQGGYGLFSISERFQHLGGAFTVESKLSLGTTVDLELPLVQHTA